ncbi:hypothetical protein Trydic_g23097 [Trypoxylus dichotomus]
MRVIVVLCTIIAITWGEELESCGDKLTCIEENLIAAVDKLDSQKKISLVDDTIVLEKTKEISVGRKKEDLIDRVMRYLSSHELKMRMPESDAREVEARKRKWRRYILPLLLILKLKAALLIPSVLTVLGFTAVTALASSSLVFGFTIVPALLRGSYTEHHHVPQKISYEVVPHLWNRAGVETLPLDHGYHTIQ